MRGVRLHNGFGWVDAALGRYALPPDGDRVTAPAEAAVTGARAFHLVAVPERVAVVTMDRQAILDRRERATIETLLHAELDHVAFVREERPGFAVVEGRGPALALAVAVAALKAIGGWDESVPIVVDANGSIISVELSFDGVRWFAHAHEARTDGFER